MRGVVKDGERRRPEGRGSRSMMAERGESESDATLEA